MARSKHPGGVQSLFCDGTVRYIANSVSEDIWFYMHGAAEGDSYTYD